MRRDGREEEAARVYGASIAADRNVPFGGWRVALERDEEDLASESSAWHSPRRVSLFSFPIHATTAEHSYRICGTYATKKPGRGTRGQDANGDTRLEDGSEGTPVQREKR